MNLMFRKNFREGAKSGGGGSKMTSKVLNRNQGKRSRDMGYGNMDPDVHYRTHIFFAPSRAGPGNDCEGLIIIFFFTLLLNCVLIRFAKGGMGGLDPRCPLIFVHRMRSCDNSEGM